MIRLDGIDPERLGADVAAAVEAHASALALALGKSLVGVGPSALQDSVRALAGYAVRGGEPPPVEERAISIPVWGRASDGAHGGTPPRAAAADLDTIGDGWLGQLVVVLRAAEARGKLAAGRDLEAAELAVLGGVTAAHVRLLLRRGEIVRRDGRGRWLVPARGARRWLESRP